MWHALGIGIANADVPGELKHLLMKRGISAAEPVEVEVGLGIFQGLVMQAGTDGASWTRRLWQQAIVEGWGQEAEVRIVRGLPVDISTWEEIDRHGLALSEAYWRSLPVYWIQREAEAGDIVERLLKWDRAVDAISWLSHHIQTKPAGHLLIAALHAAAKLAQPLEGNAATMLSHNVGVILDHLDTDPTVSEQEIASLEFSYFDALRYSRRSTRTLHRALARDPGFFVYLIKLIFFPEEGSNVVETDFVDPAKAQDLASHAYNVLDEWSHVPGADDQGEIDGESLEPWVKQARKLLSEAGRTTIGDQKIGEILSAARRKASDPWPPEPVRAVIELVRSKELERGLELGVYNRRGVTVRMPHDGGDQERALAHQYRRDAGELRFDWPRTAACLERIAEMYEADANREDIGADQRDWL
jgi:hypothetical protein